MTLEINEDWITERVKLDHDNLDDVKSLALPGTYHEKITGLGFSLQNFTRLQHLDLSKNNVVSLKGLEHLSLLEQLNLYYNKIQDLKEIFRLRKNQNLREIDLRLNPVTGNEPDYRLFITHMLPLLRRLDDRPVRDSERKAALLHFTSNDPLDLVADDEVKSEKFTATTKSRQPRVDYVKTLVQKPTVVQDDDTVSDVIDYVNNGMGKRQVQTGSKPSSQMHSKDDLVKIVRKQSEAIEREVKSQGENRRVKFTNKGSNEDNLKFKDEAEAYSQFKSRANFTPHPGTNDLPPTVNKMNEATEQEGSEHSEEFQKLPECTRLSFGESTTNQEVARRKNLTQVNFVESVLDLVDRYWNGSKSLHYHQKFQSLVQKPLEIYEKDLSSAREVQIKVLQDKLNSHQKENEELRCKLLTASEQTSPDSEHIKELSHAHQELESAKSRLQLTLSDNKILRSKISELENEMKTSKQEDVAKDKLHTEELERERKDLIQQVASLKRNNEQYEKIAKLATMLQDSHRSLVATNEHLLNELEDTRGRHQSEIEQLKWSYDQLRTTSKLTNGHAIDDEL
ncbi:unnamed protein product [Clavelina lepadiformis]|uniref:Centrosomal protein of 72 kDa n=1 Tax=Clavelina lepadiformis TaxID=159417 RepID=A0ABP0GNS3_CLALP